MATAEIMIKVELTREVSEGERVGELASMKPNSSCMRMESFFHLRHDLFVVNEEHYVGRIKVALKVTVLALVDTIIGMDEVVVGITGLAIGIGGELDELAFFSGDEKVQ
jgi:hypothetical protein